MAFQPTSVQSPEPTASALKSGAHPSSLDSFRRPTPAGNHQPTQPRLVKAIGWVLFTWLAWPLAVYRLFRNKTPLWQKLTLIGVGLLPFVVTYALLGIIGFAQFLPALDVSVGNRSDRTITNSVDHYAVTFLKTSRETGGAYELVKVQLGPQGGNDWHYHTNFVESFLVQEGQLSIGLEGKEINLLPGGRAQANIRQMHKFYNLTDKPATFLVKITPGRGFEKTLRSAYGLMNTGQFGKDGMPKSLWHLCLLLGYSESYMPGLPGFIQEPLVQSLAKIAQWKGEDKALERFYK